MKKIIKYLVFFLGGLIALFSVWFILNMIDEDLEEGIGDFFYEDSVNQEENGFIALSGINAPENANIFNYGKKKLAELEKQEENFSSEQDERSFSEKNALEKEVNLVGEGNFQCWIRPSTDDSVDEDCASEKTVMQSLQDNALLLERYATLYAYKRFVGRWYGGNPQLTIDLHRLFLTKLVWMASNGSPEKALQLWLKDTKYWQGVLADKQTILGKSIVIVISGRNAHVLPLIIQQQPDLAIRYRRELMDILSVPAFGKGGWDVASTMRAEYNVIKMMDKFVLHNYPNQPILYKSNATNNKFYKFAKDMVWLSSQPAVNFKKSQKLIDDKYINRYFPDVMWKHIIYNYAGNLVLNGVFLGTDLLEIRHYHIAYLRMLQLYIDAKSKNIQLVDMQEFLRKSGGKFLNPLTEKSFEWDSESENIYFVGYEGVSRKVRY